MNNSSSIEFEPLRFTVMFSSGALILTLNLVVLGLTFTLQDLRSKTYRYFFINMAVHEAVLGLNTCLGQALIFPEESWVCLISGIVFSYLAVALPFLPIPILLSRYLAICHAAWYESFSEASQVLPFGLLFIVGYFPTAVFPAEYGHEFGVCTHKPFLYHRLYFFATLLLSQGTIIFCTVRIVKKLAELEQSQQRLGSSVRDRLKTTRFLLRTAWIQTVSPILLTFPAVLANVIAAPHDLFWPQTFVFGLNGVVDPLCTLLIVIPYRKALVSCVRKMESTVHTGPSPGSGI